MVACWYRYACGLVIFWTGRDNYKAADGLDIQPAGNEEKFGMKLYQLISIGSLLLIPLCYVLIQRNQFDISIGETQFTFPLMTVLLLALFAYVAMSLIRAGIAAGEKYRDRMIALVIFMIINVIFWACFEQAGTSLTLFADRNVDREIFGWVMPASMTQFFNPFFIVLFGSIFTVMWVKLDKIGKNPSIPMKFSLGILQLGLGFLITLVGIQFVDDNNMVPLLTLVFLYMLHTTGELFLSPIGLSMVTKLAPKDIAGTAMGGWFLSFAIANYAGGLIATLTGGHGGDVTADSASGLSQYTDVFSTIGIVLVVFAILIALLSKPLNKLMHGVK